MRRGCHLITATIVAGLPEISSIRIGFLHCFLLHTSASLTINENTDPDVLLDMETSLNRIVPESQSFRHTMEGSDDMPAHVKSSLLGCSLTVPITDRELALGTWQGIYLCEHRDQATARTIVLTAHGTE
jgi:secondary thiamine-phosphate synthase enzyme